MVAGKTCAGKQCEDLTRLTSAPAVEIYNWPIRIAMMLTVVVLGAANNITKQIATRPLHNYTYMLGLATAVLNLPVYGLCYLFYKRQGKIQEYQIDFMWRQKLFYGFPTIMLFVLTSTGDTLGLIIGMICAPYVSGPLQSLLAAFTPIFIALLSLIFIGRRYSLGQSVGMTGVIMAVIVGGLPSFLNDSGGSGTNPTFAMILAGSCIFNAMSFMIQELIFARYTKWKVDEGVLNDDGEPDQKGLHVFNVSFASAIFSLPLTLLCVPLNQVMGQTNGEGIIDYMREALVCVFYGECGSGSVGEEYCGLTVVIYIFFNIAWNISIVTSVKLSGALMTFVALKGVFPASTFLFAFVDWPLLGKTPVYAMTWLSIVLLLPCIALFQTQSAYQEYRYPCHSKHVPGDVLCCWPLLNPKRAPTSVEPEKAPVPDANDPLKFRKAATIAGFTTLSRERYACPYKNLPDCRTDKGAPCGISCLIAKRGALGAHVA